LRIIEETKNVIGIMLGEEVSFRFENECLDLLFFHKYIADNW